MRRSYFQNGTNERSQVVCYASGRQALTRSLFENRQLYAAGKHGKAAAEWVNHKDNKFPSSFLINSAFYISIIVNVGG